MESSTTYTGLSPESGTPIAVTVADGLIRKIEPQPGASVATWISPGWIDLQVNGFAGVDYNSTTTTTEQIGRSIQVQRKTGVTRLLPTVITGDLGEMAACLANLVRAKGELAEGASIAGFHVEGPWISAEDGPRGAHPLEHVRPASVEEFKRLQDAGAGLVRLLTLAPESTGALALIEYAAESGVIVSIGHTGATNEQIDDAVSAGATMTTHLGNGAHTVLPKGSNYILRQMADDRLFAGLIVDGIHLSPEFVKIAVRAKGPQRAFLVTDAVAPAGCEPGLHQLGSQQVRLSADGSVRLPDGRLSGSSLRMDEAVENVMRFAGLGVEQAVRMASVNAAQAIALEERNGFLNVGDPAELVLFTLSAEGRLAVTDVVSQE
ncbi:MAG: N-acetylglucosamine-6-phosphate deacetylase [Acidobacteria bacterium]|nr:N-acetylglucosamine-6-phosphate deacetylase [Acidobacteriota bacterium]